MRKMRIRNKYFISEVRGYHKNKVIFVSCFAYLLLIMIMAKHEGVIHKSKRCFPTRPTSLATPVHKMKSLVLEVYWFFVKILYCWF
jgi:hypothetical protein